MGIIIWVKVMAEDAADGVKHGSQDRLLDWSLSNTNEIVDVYIYHAQRRFCKHSRGVDYVSVEGLLYWQRCSLRRFLQGVFCGTPQVRR